MSYCLAQRPVVIITTVKSFIAQADFDDVKFCRQKIVAGQLICLFYFLCQKHLDFVLLFDKDKSGYTNLWLIV